MGGWEEWMNLRTLLEWSGTLWDYFSLTLYMLNVVWTSPVCPGSYYAGAACLWRVLHCAVLAGATMTVSCVPAPCLYCEDVLVIFPGLTSKHWPSLSEK